MHSSKVVYARNWDVTLANGYENGFVRFADSVNANVILQNWKIFVAI